MYILFVLSSAIYTKLDELTLASEINGKDGNACSTLVIAIWRLTPCIPPKTASVGAAVLLEPSTASYSLG